MRFRVGGGGVSETSNIFFSGHLMIQSPFRTDRRLMRHRGRVRTKLNQTYSFGTQLFAEMNDLSQQ
jgi:hypothetical protein